MKKDLVMSFKSIFMGLVVFVPTFAFAEIPYIGLYQTIDDETNKPKSVVALYEYKDADKDLLAGRIVALYDEAGNLSETLANPVKVADKVDGSPKYVGLDIVWNMEWDKDEYNDGKIMDPKKGNVYSSVIWQEEPDKLRVRGKIGPFGRTQIWNVLSGSEVPAELKNIDTQNWKPVIRK